MNRRMNIASLLVALAVILCCRAAPAEDLSRPAWDEETLHRFATLPVQDQGRIKPLDTFARFTLLKLNGKRSFTSPEGERLSPVEWLLDCLFYPEAAKDYAHFVMDVPDAVVALGVSTHNKKRSRYSYSELAPGRDTLMQLASHYERIPARERARVEDQILGLAHNVISFEQIIRFFDFARRRFTVEGDTALTKALGEPGGAPLSVVLERAPQVLAQLQGKVADRNDPEYAAFEKLYDELQQALFGAEGIALLPPEDTADKEWMTPADVAMQVLETGHAHQGTLVLLADLERLGAARGDRALFSKELTQFHAAVTALAQKRGEYAKIPVEVAFYRGKYFFYSQWLYVLSFILVAVSWLMPKRKWIHWLTPIAVLIPTGLLITGITYRCIIRGRPPVTTLYETLLFTTAVAVLVALVVELVNRRRVGVAVGAVLGMAGMFLAYRYEAKEGVDTMPQVIAVLDTNFWLATHVTTIVAGYGAALLAAAMAHVYILGRLAGIRKHVPDFYPNLDRMIYGVLCFGLLFSLIGTVLGGIWANESWGRFWGWDPKENGALLIVLWGLIILHARRGGYIRATGTSVSCIVLGMITAFSWWGVNLLGVGLHSYGFTSGIMNALVVFWLVETAVACIGMALANRGKNGANAARKAEA